MRNEIGQQYGLLTSILDSGELQVPADIDVDDYGDLTAEGDLHGINMLRLRAAITNREKTISILDSNAPKAYALMWKYISMDSQEAVLRHEDFDEDTDRNDPVALYLSIKATHTAGGGDMDEDDQKAEARQAYNALRQGPMESIAQFKSKFSFGLEVRESAGNEELPPADVAMDFLHGLDNTRYAKFKAELKNDRAKGVDTPRTLSDMFHRASTYTVVSSSWRATGGAAFASRADDQRPRQRDTPRESKRSGDGKSGKSGKSDKGKQKSASDGSGPDTPKNSGDGKKPGRRFANVTCYNCNEQGHMSFDCPKETGEDDMDVGTAFATRGGMFHPLQNLLADDSDDEDGPLELASDSSDDEEEVPDAEPRLPSVARGRAHVTTGKLAWYEVLLDNQADISAVHTRLLYNLMPQTSYVSGLSGTAMLPYVGELDGFFECKGSEDLPASVLCMADVEEIYPISYVQGESYTVHMRGRDLVFRKRDKLYVANMLDWGSKDNPHRALVSTVSDNESRYTAKEVKRAREVREMVSNAGFSSEREALGLVNDGNLAGVPVTARDVKRSFDIHGKSTPGVRGRRTAHKAPLQRVDPDLKARYGEPQEMYGDVVYFRAKPYVMCLSEPLGLLTTTQVADTKAKTLGAALHAHVNTIQSRGFHPTIIHLDPQPGFVALDCNIPGVETDIGGAGDHMDRLDVEIRHVKEVFRSVCAGLPWAQPEQLDKDLAEYCTSRKNLRSTAHSKVSPRVKFTGRKPDFKKELGLGYGDYVECYIPESTGKKTDQPRTEPCIALCPTGNANGSWRFMSLKTKRRVRRSNWQKMVTTDLVINFMNEYAREGTDEGPATEEDDVADDEPPVLDLTGEEVEAGADGVEEADGHEDGPPANDGEGPPLDEDVPAPAMRKSARVVEGVRRPVRFSSYHTSVKRGLKEHGADAYKAIVAELRQLLREKKALAPVHRGDLSARQLKKVIRSLMFLKTKFDGLGRFEKIKARLVANGKQQDRELYPDTYSPTVALQSVLMCLTLAAAEGRKVCAIDIGGAYLNADRNSAEGEEVIMGLEPMLVAILGKVAPEIKPFVDEKGRLLVKLNKAMYGTLDAAKIWYDKLTGVLRTMGFVPNEVDPCVLNKTVRGKQCTILLYVDDLLVTCKDPSAILEVIASLEQAFEGDVKACHDKDLSYLGMHLKIEGGCVTVSTDSTCVDIKLQSILFRRQGCRRF